MTDFHLEMAEAVMRALIHVHQIASKPHIYAFTALQRKCLFTTSLRREIYFSVALLDRTVGNANKLVKAICASRRWIDAGVCCNWPINQTLWADGDLKVTVEDVKSWCAYAMTMKDDEIQNTTTKLAMLEVDLKLFEMLNRSMEAVNKEAGVVMQNLSTIVSEM